MLAWDQFWLSDTPDAIGSATWGNSVTRIVVRARLRDLVSGEESAMINTHFDHQSEPARIKSAPAMIDLFEGGELTLRAGINVTTDRDGRFPSDHAPVQALVLLP